MDIRCQYLIKIFMKIKRPQAIFSVPECDGEVHEVPGLITDRDDPGLWVDDGAGVELLLVHAVDDVPLRAVGPAGADDVDLVILPGQEVFIHFNDVLILSPESSTKYRV